MSMPNLNHPAWIEVNIAQFKKNISILREFLGTAQKICLPIKANAYGHGLLEIAKAGEEENVAYLGVAHLKEGILLRKNNIKLPILVFGAIHLEQINELIEYDLEFTIASIYKARLVADIANKIDKIVKIHVEVDTGMQRTGMRTTTAPELLRFIRDVGCFEIKGVYSHLATADELDNPFTAQQAQNFISFLEREELISDPNITCHLLNSAGIISLPDARLDMVRPGGMLFGCQPYSIEHVPESLRAIAPCLSVKAKVAYYKNVPEGTGISYNHTHVVAARSNILTIPVGYGDGLRRSLSNNGHVLHNGKRYPIVGNICMDQFMIDCGQDPGYVGDVVTILGSDKQELITCDEMSDRCNTHPYEILCGFSERLPRIYKYSL